MSPEEAGEALRLAVKARDLDGVRRLLATRPDVVGWRDERGRTALFLSRNLQILEALLEGGAEIGATDVDGWTPLLRHAVAGDTELLALLLRHGARVDARARDGRTALHAAAAFLGLDSMKLLLAHGADPQARNQHGYAPIHEALGDSNLVTARWLWEGPGPRDLFGAAALGEVPSIAAEVERDPPSRDRADGRGWSPLHWSAMHLQPGATRALLARGASAGAVDPRGWTPLHWAVYSAARGAGAHADQTSRDVAAALLDHGADPGPRAADRKTPLDLAIAAGRRKPLTIALLESRGARSTAIPGEER